MRFLLLALILATACSDRDGPRDTTDAGGSDVGRADAGDLDSGAPDASDAGLDDAQVDAPENDAGLDAASIDAGTDVGGPDPCVTFTVGDPCTEGSEECGMDGRYTCDLSFRRCVPADDRPICGGFAGAACPTDGPFTQCLLNIGASGGPCLRVEEVACVCPAHSDFYSCPE